MDFGVAKSTLSGEGGLTGEGIMVGTPAYMSPEQINGTEVSPATDLYAVALVFAEMLTGKPVYDAAPLMVCMDKVRNLPVPFAEQLKRSAYFEVLDRATRLDPGARLDRFPRAQQRDGGQKRREDHQQQADPVDAHVIRHAEVR